MPKTTPEQLAHLKALEARATKPWKYSYSEDHGEVSILGPDVDQFDPPQAEHAVAFRECWEYPRDRAVADFQCIAEARNALDALIADAEAYHALLAFIRERVQAMEREVAELIRTGQVTHAEQLGMITGAVEAVADWAENREAGEVMAAAMKI